MASHAHPVPPVSLLCFHNKESLQTRYAIAIDEQSKSTRLEELGTFHMFTFFIMSSFLDTKQCYIYTCFHSEMKTAGRTFQYQFPLAIILFDIILQLEQMRSFELMYIHFIFPVAT